MSPKLQSGLYVGRVIHQRLSPKRHFLSYGLFQILIDLDQIEGVLAGLKNVSHNRFNLFGLFDQDFGPKQADPGQTLSQRMRSFLAPKGLISDCDSLFLLTMPRVLGFGFNPISLYFVQAPDGAIRCVLYEVNNTFGDRHTYVLSVDTEAVLTNGRIRQSCSKHLHVSPFMVTEGMSYDFDILAPATRFAMKIKLKSATETLLFASFAAQRKPLTDQNLWALFWSIPLMTFKVLGAIHWEAIKLIVKGIWLKPKPKTPKFGVSFDPVPPIAELDTP